MAVPILTEITVSDGKGNEFKASIFPVTNPVLAEIVVVMSMGKNLTIKERIDRLIRIANDRHAPATVTIGSIGLIANPNDDPEHILRYFEKVLARK